jgi:hypothetical protein
MDPSLCRWCLPLVFSHVDAVHADSFGREPEGGTCRLHPVSGSGSGPRPFRCAINFLVIMAILQRRSGRLPCTIASSVPPQLVFLSSPWRENTRGGSWDGDVMWLMSPRESEIKLFFLIFGNPFFREIKRQALPFSCWLRGPRSLDADTTLELGLFSSRVGNRMTNPANGYFLRRRRVIPSLAHGNIPHFKGWVILEFTPLLHKTFTEASKMTFSRLGTSPILNFHN